MNITAPVKFQEYSAFDANVLNHKFNKISELIYTYYSGDGLCIPYIFINETEFHPSELYANLDSIIESVTNILYHREKHL